MSSNKLKEKTQLKIAEVKEKRLTGLDLRGCGLTLAKLPKEIFELTHLEVLNLSNTWQNAGEDRNRIEGLPPEIAQLRNLKELHIWDCNLKDLPEEMSALTNLEELDVSGNSLEYLPLSITKLKNLKRLDLRFNKIKILPLEVLELENLENIYLEGNPLDVPPQKLIEQGTPDVIEYLKSLKNDSSFFYGAKAILVGDSGVGKTSLMHLLVDKDLELNENIASTEKINTRTWSISKEKTGFEQDFYLHIWDFPSAEIYHSMHRLFFSENTIYLLLLSAQTTLHSVYYWLNTIENFSGENSPILLIHNKVDISVRDFPVQEFRSEFKSIAKDVQLVSCKFDRKNASHSIENSIISLIKKLPQVRNKAIPYAWVQVHLDLEVEKGSYITYEKYEGEICKRYGVDKDGADLLANFFHNLGMFLHFKNDKILQRKIFLDRNWIINGIYLVFRNQRIIDKDGKMSDEDIKLCFQGTVYESEEDRISIILLMELLKFCFPVRGEKGTYIFPQFLNKDIPKKIQSNTYKPQFEYNYNGFVPNGLLFEYMAQMYNKVSNIVIWHYGILCKIDETSILIQEHTKNPKITIDSQKESIQGALQQIRLTFEAIHKGFPKLFVEEKVICTCNYCKIAPKPYFHNYERLLKIVARYRKDAEDRCGNSLEAIPVVNLIKKASSNFNEEIKKRGFKMVDPISENMISNQGKISNQLSLIETRFSKEEIIKIVSSALESPYLEHSNQEKMPNQPSREKKIKIISGLPAGPYIDFFEIDPKIIQDYCAIFYDISISEDAVTDANQLHKEAHPAQNDVQIIRMSNLPSSTLKSFWRAAFKSACSAGPRMLLALLFQVNPNILKAKTEYQELFDRLLDNKW